MLTWQPQLWCGNAAMRWLGVRYAGIVTRIGSSGQCGGQCGGVKLNRHGAGIGEGGVAIVVR